MRPAKTFSFVLWLAYFTSLTISAIASPQFKGTLKFIENKNQWPKQVLFSADIPGGKVYVEKNRLLYAFFDAGTHRHLHQSNSGPETIKNIIPNEPDSIWFHSFEVRFEGANPKLKVEPKEAFKTRYNYFIGNDPEKWAEGASAYGIVILSDIYPHIDLKLYSHGDQIKYDFVVHPGGNINKIKLKYDGIDNISLDNRDVCIPTKLGEVTEVRPYSYQIENGAEKKIVSNFKLKDKTLSFDLPDGYDKEKTLIIDPEVVFSLYSGSTADNWGNTATYDSLGNLYSGGIVARSGYPATIGAFQTYHAGGDWDIGIMKYDSTGRELLYATYLGGNRSETPQSLVVNNAGELLILGATSSRDFPVTNGSTFNGGTGFEPMSGVPYSNGSDIFIAKLSADGSQLLGGTFLGGSDNDGINFISGEFNTTQMVESPLCRNYGDQFRGDIITDDEDNVYISSNTTSHDFPIVNTETAFNDGSHDAVLVKLRPNLSEIIWSRFLGGSATDAAYSLKLDIANNIYIAGGTNSDDFQEINGYHIANSGGIDGWIAQVSSDGMNIINATYIGTSSYDQAYFVDLDKNGDVYLYGQTQGSYPVTGGVYSETNGGQFIHKLSKDLQSSMLSTVFGSGNNSPNISPTAFLVSDCDNIYIAGWGGALNATTITRGTGPESTRITRNFVGGSTFGLTVSDNAYQNSTSGNDFYLMVLDANASAFLYGTFMGGSRSVTHVDGGTSRFDKTGTVYHAVCAGCGGLSDFPAVNAPAGHELNAANSGSGCNNAAFKFDLAILSAVVRTNSVALDNPGVDTLCLSEQIVFQNFSTGAQYYYWDLGDGTVLDVTDTAAIVHEYENPGAYTVTLKAYNDELCDNEDVASVVVWIFDPEFEHANDADICYGSKYTLFARGGSVRWVSTDSTFISTAPEIEVSPIDTTVYRLTITSPYGCTLEDSVVINVIPYPEFTHSIDKVHDCWNRPLVHLNYNTEQKDKYEFVWDLGDGTTSSSEDFEHNYEQDGNYTIALTVSNEFCSYKLTQPVHVYTIQVPNVFTPNNDDKNGVFEILSDTTVGLQVFDRWGEKVYEEKDYRNTWDAHDLSTGVYYYLADIEEETTCKGWIYVLR